MITSAKRTRRRILQGGLVAAAAAATWHPSVLSGLLRPPPAVAQSLPQLPARIGAGKSVAIIGAGIAGLTTAYELLRGGFDVTVFEAESRYGGRSLTVRPSDPDYKAWAIDRYPNLTDFTYVDTIPAEVRGAKVPAQTARFHPHRIGDGYFDMHFNAGPGRIPTIHTGILHYCRQFGVEMAPYLFVSEGNLLQSAILNGGKPVQVRQFLYDMLGHISELLYLNAGEALTRAQARNARAIETQLKSFLVSLGDLSAGGRFAGSSRAGYAVVPGAGTNSGIMAPQLSLDEMLAEGSIWADVMDSAHLDWQLPLLEPVGGMDMIWQAFLAETVGGAPLHTRIKLNHNVIGLTRDGTTAGPIDVTTRGPDGEANAAFDYVVMTGVPILMRDMDLTNVAGEALYDDVSSLLISGGFKYGWQARTRFWEAPDTGIFGGISFTGHMIKQIWYPSNGYNGPTGILTGAY
ncbi:MAG: FAD-dependent oxidoreductase, partial [Pseudomonadota bacterium]